MADFLDLYLNKANRIYLDNAFLDHSFEILIMCEEG